jgi:clan AA aspartic protease (TIGR02281 family)
VKLGMVVAAFFIGLLGLVVGSHGQYQYPISPSAAPSDDCIKQGTVVSGTPTRERQVDHAGNIEYRLVFILHAPICAEMVVYTREGFKRRVFPSIQRLGFDWQVPSPELFSREIAVELGELWAPLDARDGRHGSMTSFRIVRRSDVAPAIAPQTTATIEVPMVRRNGIFAVPVVINHSVTINFVVDSGASHVSIPLEVFQSLKDAGTIGDTDMRGEVTYMLADGTQKNLKTLQLKSLTVSSVTLANVASAVSDRASPPLLGMSFLGRFKGWSVDNQRHLLVLKQ